MRLDHLGLAAPDIALAPSAPCEILLVVNGAEEDVARQSGGEDHGRGGVREVVRVPCEVLSLKCVDGREPDHRPPGEVEAVVVVADVDCAEVPKRSAGFKHWIKTGNIPVLVNEEIDNVECVQNVDNDHRVGNKAVLLVLVGGEREITA